MCTEAGEHVTRSAGDTVVTSTKSEWENNVAVLGGSLARGVHCWELQINNFAEGSCIMIGVCKAGVNVASTASLWHGSDAWFIDPAGNKGTLFGNGKNNSDKAGGLAAGDRLGCCLDLGAGTLSFFKNGAPHGPGHTSVVGPVKRCVEFSRRGNSVTVWRDAVEAAGRGRGPGRTRAAGRPTAVRLSVLSLRHCCGGAARPM